MPKNLWLSSIWASTKPEHRYDCLFACLFLTLSVCTSPPVEWQLCESRDLVYKHWLALGGDSKNVIVDEWINVSLIQSDFSGLALSLKFFPLWAQYGIATLCLYHVFVVAFSQPYNIGILYSCSLGHLLSSKSFAGYAWSLKWCLLNIFI